MTNASNTTSLLPESTLDEYALILRQARQQRLDGTATPSTLAILAKLDTIAAPKTAMLQRSMDQGDLPPQVSW